MEFVMSDCCYGYSHEPNDLTIATFELHDAQQEIERLKKKLKHIATMCGNPDAAEGCRLILKEIAKEKEL